MAQEPSYSLAYQARLKMLQDSISSAKEQKDQAGVGAATPQDEIRPRNAVQLGYKKVLRDLYKTNQEITIKWHRRQK